MGREGRSGWAGLLCFISDRGQSGRGLHFARAERVASAAWQAVSRRRCGSLLPTAQDRLRQRPWFCRVVSDVTGSSGRAKVKPPSHPGGRCRRKPGTANARIRHRVSSHLLPIFGNVFPPGLLDPREGLEGRPLRTCPRHVCGDDGVRSGVLQVSRPNCGTRASSGRKEASKPSRTARYAYPCT